MLGIRVGLEGWWVWCRSWVMNGDGEWEEDKCLMSCDDNWFVDMFKVFMESCNVLKISFKFGLFGLIVRILIKLLIMLWIEVVFSLIDRNLKL